MPWDPANSDRDIYLTKNPVIVSNASAEEIVLRAK